MILFGYLLLLSISHSSLDVYEQYEVSFPINFTRNLQSSGISESETKKEEDKEMEMNLKVIYLAAQVGGLFILTYLVTSILLCILQKKIYTFNSINEYKDQVEDKKEIYKGLPIDKLKFSKTEGFQNSLDDNLYNTTEITKL